MDLVIRNGMIVDGSGAPGFAGDIGIEDGRIASIGTVHGDGAQEIDAKGAVVAPGFIDVHTHYDAQVFWDPMLSPSVFHGVTTVLAGNCGFTLAPLSGKPEDTDYLLRMLSRVEGMPLETLRSAVKPDWTSFGAYLDTVNDRLAINAVFLVGHSAIRRAVMGERAVTDKATPDELERMKTLLRVSLQEGGAGFSTTISYTHSDFEGNPVPSRVASHEEIVALSEVLVDYPGTWLEMVFGVKEMEEKHWKLAADMSRGAQRPLNWNVLQIDSNNSKPMESKLHAGDYARAHGATVHALVPSTPMFTILNFVNCFVIDTIPTWDRLIAMSLPERRAALADPAFRAALKAGAATTDDSPTRISNWPGVVLEGLALPDNLEWNGRMLGDCAAARGVEPLDALFDLAVEENLGVCFSRAAESTDDRSWEIRRALWRDSRCMIGGSDAGAHLDMLNSFAFSTQLLGEGVRRRGLIPLEEAVHRITALPAERFGIKNRGTIAVGMMADLVIFDPDTVDCGPIEMRHDLPEGQKRLYADSIGIGEVIVGGIVVARGNEPTGKLAGRVLRSGIDTETVPVGI